MEHYTYSQIFSMNLPEIMTVASEHNVLLDGCQTLDEWRERLWLHTNWDRKNHFDIRKEFILGSSETQVPVRESMDNLLNKLHKAVAQLSQFPVIEKALHFDCTGSDAGPSLIDQIEARRKSLKEAQCSVIVAGETNAGKSTLLNLILGMNILPCSVLSCTAAVCVLRYSENLSAQIEFKDGRATEDMTFSSVEEACERLTKVVAETDDDRRERASVIKTINVYLPAVILQNGVTLVDTPGIGENDEMDKCTLNYVKQNSAAAYVYVIKTDNAGGMQEDRLLEFLRAILDHNKSGDGAEVFDPTSAMFVCNRWDQVPAEQKDRVRQYAYTKLKDAWPKFEPSQAHFISTTNSLLHWEVNPAYVTREFESVLKGLKDVFSKARHNAVNQHYCWLKHQLHQSTMFLQATLAHCNHSDEDLADRFRSTAQKLEALQNKTTDIISLLRRRLEEATLRLCDVIADILAEDDTRKALIEWDLSTVPDTPAPGSSRSHAWAEEVDTVIIKRLVEIVDKVIQERGLANELETSFRSVAKKELKLVDEEMDSIEGDMKDQQPTLGSSCSSSISSASSCSSDELMDSAASELFRLYKERNGVRLRHLSHVPLARTSSVKSAEIMLGNLPRVSLQNLGKKMFAPLAKLALAVRNQRRKSVFETNPTQYLNDRGLKIADVMANDRPCLEQMAVKYRERLDLLIMDIENSIPNFIAVNKQLMDDIKAHRRQFLSQRREMRTVMEKLEPLRELLRGFGSLYIRDVTADNICFTLNADRRRSSVMVSVMDLRGLPDSGYNGSIHRQSGCSSLRSSYHMLNRSNTDGTSTLMSHATGSVAACLPQGLWHTYRKGKMTIGEDDQESVMGRTYIQALPDEQLIREIARLRCLRSSDLAPFLGMSRMENTAVFLFVGDLMPARKYLRAGFHDPKETVPHLLEGVLRGLDYMHKEGLVHMELSMDTVMVDTSEGNAKLCGACLPRNARFPPDADLVEARPFVYLSPEVLRGELYTADDDVYSFGLLVWETCLKDEPYTEQRSWSLAEFRSKVHPSSMLGMGSRASSPDQQHQHLSENLDAILRGCILLGRGLRLPMDKLRDMTGMLRSDITVTSLSAVSRRFLYKQNRVAKHRRNASYECDETSSSAPHTFL